MLQIEIEGGVVMLLLLLFGLSGFLFFVVISAELMVACISFLGHLVPSLFNINKIFLLIKKKPCKQTTMRLGQSVNAPTEKTQKSYSLHKRV